MDKISGLMALLGSLLNNDPVGMPGPKYGQRVAKQHNARHKQRTKQPKTRGKTKYLGRSKRGG